MSWDDDVIGGSAATGDDNVLLASWDDELGDEPVVESWDAPEEPKSEPKPKSKPASGKKSKAKSVEPEQKLMAIDVLDEKTRQELIKKAELDSDLNNAADLFAGLGVAEEHPRAAALRREQEALAAAAATALTKDTPIENHPLFQTAETKKDYQDLRKAVSTAVVSMHEKSSLNYASSLAIDLIRDVAKPMSIESIRQTIATLNILMKDKEREERQARLARVKGGTAQGGAGKKKAKGAKANLGGAFKKDQQFDMGEVEFDDFGDDDFM